MGYGPNDGNLPFTGFSPTLGSEANVPATSGNVKVDGMTQADHHLSRMLRSNGNIGQRKLLTSLIGVAATTEATAAFASGTIRFDIIPDNDDTVTFNGTAITFKTSGATGNEVDIAGTIAETIDDLITLLEASVDAEIVKFTYARSGDTLYITAASAGAAGNALTIAASNASHVESGATLSGGVTGVTAASVTQTYARVQGAHLHGGVSPIETATVLNKTLSTANKNRLVTMLTRSSAPSSYPTDLSGNGGGGRVGF